MRNLDRSGSVGTVGAGMGIMAGAEQVVGHFFALDSHGRIAWPFRYVERAGLGTSVQRWRFGRWVESADLRSFLTGEDDMYTAASPEQVSAWIARETRFGHPVLLASA